MQIKIKNVTSAVLLGLSAMCVLLGNSIFIVAQQKKIVSVEKQKTQLRAKKETRFPNRKNAGKTVGITNDSKVQDNRIVSVCRINLIIDDVREDGTHFKNKREYIEIRLFSKEPRPTNVGNERLIIKIGEKRFLSYSVGHIKDVEKITLNDIFVTMTPKEFDDLADSSIIRYTLDEEFDETTIKEIYEKGEPKAIKDRIFGKLNKKMLDECAVVERFNSP